MQTLAKVLTTADFMKRLIFIKDALLTQAVGRTYSVYQRQLINAISNTGFIRVDRYSYRKVCELKSPDVNVFKVMCTAEDFPPKEYDIKEWQNFFVLLGFQKKLSDSHYLQYAEEIAHEGKLSGISNELKAKSVALTESLMRETSATNGEDKPLSPSTLHELSRIKFLVPGLVEACYSDIFRQHGGASSLICFDGAVTFDVGESFWTVVHVLPEICGLSSILFESSIDKRWLCDNLNILQSPTDEQVVRHCQKIGCVLRQKLGEIKEHEQPTTWIGSLMIKIYDALDKINKEFLNDKLSDIPLIFFPHDYDILPAKMTILDCNVTNEIPPYLRKIPAELGKYQHLFHILGASPKPSLHQYMHVLQVVKQSVGETKLGCIEYKVICSAIENMLEVMKNTENQTSENLPSTLYLPDSELMLKDAKN